MRILFVFLIVGISVFFANAQDKILPADFGYNNKVKQVEEVYYKYSPASKRYNINEEQTLYFTKGKLTHQSRLVNFIDVTAYDTYYTYNTAGQLLTCIEKVNGTEKSKYNYIYKNGKLIAKNGTNADKKEEQLFTYNLKGQLAQITSKKDGELKSTIAFTNYKLADTYTKTTTNYIMGKVSDIEVKNYVNGLLVEIGNGFGESGHLSITKLEYDNKGNKISASSAFSNSVNAYQYDDGGNAFRALFGGVQTQQGKSDNVFRFSKITYISGMSLGTTDLNYLFVNSYEKDVASYKTQERLKRPASGTKPSNLLSLITDLAADEVQMSVEKNADGTYRVLDGTGQDIIKEVSRIKAPNGLDLLVYDSVFDDVFFFENFYTASIGAKLSGKCLPESAKGAYFVRTNQGKSIYMIYQGKYFPLSEYRVTKAANGLDVYVEKEGKTLYVFKNYFDNNLVKEDVFYPVTQL